MTIAEAYNLLGLRATGATPTEAQTAFRKAVSKSHPDLETRPELKEAANEKTRIIIEAYEMLKAHGFPQSKKGEVAPYVPTVSHDDNTQQAHKSESIEAFTKLNLLNEINRMKSARQILIMMGGTFMPTKGAWKEVSQTAVTAFATFLIYEVVSRTLKLDFIAKFGVVLVFLTIFRVALCIAAATLDKKIRTAVDSGVLTTLDDAFAFFGLTKAGSSPQKVLDAYSRLNDIPSDQRQPGVTMRYVVSLYVLQHYGYTFSQGYE